MKIFISHRSDDGESFARRIADFIRRRPSRAEQLARVKESSVLNLLGWNVTSLTETEDTYQVEAEVVPDFIACTHCASEQVYRHGTRTQEVRDLPSHKKRVVIALHRRRYKCRACGRTFLQPLDELDNEHNMTARLADYIRKQSFKDTFLSLERETGVSEALVRLIFLRRVEELEKDRRVYTPVWLGIDEVFVTKKSRAIFTDVKERKPVELLADRRMATVAAFLRTLDVEKVQLVTMDMWNPYREAVKAVLPNAQIIVDRFHVVKLANQMMENVRKRIRSEMTEKRSRQLKGDRYILLRRRDALNDQQKFILDTWIQNYRELGDAYVAKEMFCDIWEYNSREMAVAEYARWLQWIESVNIKAEFYELIRAVTNWHDEIFAYFDNPLTNAYTEAFNGVLKLTQRTGRGYSFRVIRGRMLYRNHGDSTRTDK